MPDPTDTNYFSKQPGLIPDFTHYYTGFGDPSTWGNSGIGVVHTTPAMINGKPSIIFLMFKPAAVAGMPSTDPVPAVEVILQQQANGVFTDVTAQLLGSATTPNGFRLNSEPSGAVVAYLGGSSNPAIIISQTNDDGRNNGSNGAGNLAVSQIQLPQADGTYKTFDLGGPQFSDQGAINVYQSSNGPVIFLAGYRADGTGLIRVILPDEVAWIPLARAFAYDAASNSLTPLPDSVGDQAGYAVLDLKTVVTQVQYYSGGSNEFVGPRVALVKQDANGGWGIAQTLTPFPMHTISNVVNFTGPTGSTPVYDDNGQSIIGIHMTVGTFHSNSAGDDNPVVITTLGGVVPATPRADGNYYLDDGTKYNNFLFWDLVNGELVKSPLHLVNANTVVNNVGMQQLDLLHNGLNDLVISNLNTTGQPDVYLNDGAGDLYHVPLSQFPNSSGVLGSSIFVDLGNGKWGLLYQPSVGTYNYKTETPVMYYGTNDITITQDVTIANRHSGTNIVTWSGNDTISDGGASSASTRMDGGLGINTAIYSGKARDYSVTHGADGTISVAAKSTAPVAVNDALKNIQRLKFVDSFVYSDASTNYRITRNSDGTVTVAGTATTDSLPRDGRLQFSDFGIAYDLSGNAGTAAKLIGAIFGTSTLSNKTFVGVGLQLLDGGMSYSDLTHLALNAAGVSSHNAEVNLLWTNVFGGPPTDAQAAPFVSMLDSGAMTPEQLAIAAADSSFNTTHINLIGLQQTGILFT